MLCVCGADTERHTPARTPNLACGAPLSQVTPKVSLWTACIGTAKAGVVVAAGGGGAAAAAPAAGGDGGAKPAAAPEPEPEEEEEEMGFDLFD
eukprot:3622688-Pleurochrysis_carterae.AAC.1